MSQLKYSKISNTFHFLISMKMWVIRAGIHKMLIRLANREDPDKTPPQKQSDLGLHCLSRSILMATSVRNFSLKSQVDGAPSKIPTLNFFDPPAHPSPTPGA